MQVITSEQGCVGIIALTGRIDATTASSFETSCRELLDSGGGSRKELLQKTISRSLEQAINDRITYQAGKDEKNVIQLVDEELEGITAQVIAPIICEGDAIGSVSLMSREPKARFGEMEMKLAVTAAGFLGRQMES